MTMIVDFHSHTYESDGAFSPADLCAAMHERGVSLFSITDHDSMAAYANLSVPASMRVVTGIEINTTYGGDEVHVLGYRLPLQHAALEATLETNRLARRKRIALIVQKLQDAGYEITLQAVLAEAGIGQALGRPHVARALIRNGDVPDISTAFRTLLGNGRPANVPSTHITPQDAIAAIHAAGGVSVLAHPGRLSGGLEIIDDLVEQGLMGLEVFYPTHDAAQVKLFCDIAKKFRLLITAGSDFHDTRSHPHGVGREIDEAQIRPFLDVVT